MKTSKDSPLLACTDLSELDGQSNSRPTIPVSDESDKVRPPLDLLHQDTVYSSSNLQAEDVDTAPLITTEDNPSFHNLPPGQSYVGDTGYPTSSPGSLKLDSFGDATPSISFDNDNSAYVIKSFKSQRRVKYYSDGSSRRSASSVNLDDINQTKLGDDYKYPVKDSEFLKSHWRGQSASSFGAGMDADEEIPLNSFKNDDAYYQKSDHSSDINPSQASGFTITTGWNLKLALLLFHGLVSTCWGIALFIFSLGIVPISWDLSQKAKSAKYGEAVSNTLVALVAAVSTMHLTYIVQLIIQQYAHSLMVKGFTLAQLRYLQGIQELSIFTTFPPRQNGWKIVRFLSNRRLVWILVYAGVTFHTSSLVAILQPQIFIKNVIFNDPVECGNDPDDLTLLPQPFLNDNDQRIIDTFAYNIGLQLGSYGDQVNSNVTTAAAGRKYVKDYYAYGLVGGLHDGLEEIPGVFFSAQCTDDPKNFINIWQNAFSDLLPPTVSIANDTSRSFVTGTPAPDPIIPVFTDNGPFNITDRRAAMYGLVDPTGSGAFLSISSLTEHSGRVSQPTYVCSWKTLPKIVHVQIVNWTSCIIGEEESFYYPPLTGRATLLTLQGMAAASRYTGASLLKTTYINQASETLMIVEPKTPTEVLQTLLADGGKAGYSYFTSLGLSPIKCNSNVRTVAEHWRFGNSQNLGWVATIWTTAIGVYAIVAAVLLSWRKRMENVEILVAAEAFALGRGNIVSESDLLCVRHGRIVRAKDASR